MPYTPRDLNLTYEPDKSWAHFVLYTEPRIGVAGAAFNATARIDRQTPYVSEWASRLQRCEPNALHATLMESQKIPELFHPCVDDDIDSPAAVSGRGCVCYQTFYDPEFGLPVVAHHHRTVSGNIDQWTHVTYAPLDLRPDDVFAALIIDRECFWIRTADGVLSLLPEVEGRGYGIGYGGGGSHELAQYLTKILASGGQDTAAGGTYDRTTIDAGILTWASTKDPHRRRELTLEDLRALQRL